MGKMVPKIFIGKHKNHVFTNHNIHENNEQVIQSNKKKMYPRVKCQDSKVGHHKFDILCFHFFGSELPMTLEKKSTFELKLNFHDNQDRPKIFLIQDPQDAQYDFYRS